MRNTTDAESAGSLPWVELAAAAEEAVVSRHLRPLWGIAGTQLGVVGWPSNGGERRFVRWHYWWQAHLLDCLVDAQLRAPTDDRATRIDALVRTHRIRNAFRWTNGYFDDMAWLGLALERAQAAGIVRSDTAIRRLTARLIGAWSDAGGGIPWRVRDEFRNTPANGPAAILLARLGYLERAEDTVNWILDQLHDAESGLIIDGIHPVRGLHREIYSYCQGVVLGALTELAIRSSAEQSAAIEGQVAALVDAVDRLLADDHVLRGHGGGNGGLFTGILARYLALVANKLPTTTEAGRAAVLSAAVLVRESAASAWRNRADVAGKPLFGADWGIPAPVPRSTKAGQYRSDGAEASTEPERDLSVQLGGWMLLEAAAALNR